MLSPASSSRPPSSVSGVPAVPSSPAAAALAPIAEEARLAVTPVDVDADPELRAEFGDRVPVVLLDGREHSYFTVDVLRLRRDLGLA